MYSKSEAHKYDFLEKNNSLDSVNKKQKEEKSKEFSKDLESSLTMVKDIQKIINNCSHLSEEQKWDYCNSQRYFMKQFLRNLNKKSNID
ncbi:MAG: hypothetical protein EU547_03420 [Promethearchaeota archaeon]|nr:MAG: hypothetical protein EU547_03420 [Candidatus Lokiarchaeota archaeon]